MEKLKMWFQKMKKSFDDWIFCQQIDKLSDAIYKYGFKYNHPQHTKKDAFEIAKAIMWNDKEIQEIIGN